MLTAALLLAGCADADPLGQWFGQAERPERIEVDEEALVGETPSLGSVPDERPSVTPEAQRRALQESLRRDRDSGLEALSRRARMGMAYPGEAATPAGWQEAAVIQFLHGSANLDANDRAILNEVARAQQANQARVRVIGHSSRNGAAAETDSQANLAMSRRRAEVVAGALREAGVPSAMIEVEALGDTRPLYDESSPEGAAGNRRVEVLLNLPDPGR